MPSMDATAEKPRAGRPPLPPHEIASIRKLRGQGLSIAAIARERRLARNTVKKYLGRIPRP